MIYIGFSSTNTILSRLIRWVTGGVVSHTFLVFEMYGRPWLLEAEWDGIVVTPMEKFKAHNNIVKIFPVASLTDKDISLAMDMLGEAYDYTGVFGIIITKFGDIFKKKWRNPLNNTKALFCSEMVTKVLQNAQYPGSDILIPENTSPQDLLTFLSD